MAEFSNNMEVMLADADGNITVETNINELLPGAFTPDKLLAR